MKNIFILLTLISFNAFGQQPIKVEIVERGADKALIKSAGKAYGSQNQPVNTNNKTNSFADSYAKGAQAAAARAAAEAARAAAMSEATTNIKVPIEIDLNDYTHLALVGITFSNVYNKKFSGRKQYEEFAKLFLNSPLIVVNPYVKSKQKSKADNRWLREIKSPTYLYVYYETSTVGVDSHRSLVVRNSENKIIYQIKAVNIPKSEVVDPFVYF
jgi:hypothetical protein